MKKTTYVVFLALSGLISMTGCSEVENLAPAFDTESVKATVQGRWAIEKVSSKLCRDNSCSTSTESGHSQEYFEFKADSAFLVRKSSNLGNAAHDAYKAKYDGKMILLSNSSRSEKFEILELKTRKLVLQSVFTGRDPAAVFTDTYVLYR